MSALPVPEGYTMGDVYADNARSAAAEAADRAFQAKSDDYFRTTHPGLKPGRNFMWDVMRWRNSLGERYDETFKGAPSSPEWWQQQFCPKCDKRVSMCECGKHE